MRRTFDLSTHGPCCLLAGVLNLCGHVPLVLLQLALGELGHLLLARCLCLRSDQVLLDLRQLPGSAVVRASSSLTALPSSQRTTATSVCN